MTFKIILLATVILFNLTAIPFASADEVDTDALTTELPPVFVTASRRAESPDEITYPITVITREEIEDKQAQTAFEAIATVPGISTTSLGSPGDDSDIRIMGSDVDEVMVLIDGVPINTVLDNRPNILGTIPASIIDHIEIVEGAQTGMYGSRAVGGVINIITREAKEGISGDVNFKTGNLGRFIEDGVTQIGIGNHRLRLSYQRWDEYGRMENDRTAQNTMAINWRYHFSDALTISLSPQYYNTDQELAFDSVTEGTTVFFPRDTNRKVRRDTVLIPLSLTLNAKPWWEADFEYSYYYQFMRLTNPPTGDVTPGTVLGDQFGRSNEDRHRFSFRNTFTPLNKNGFQNLVTLGFDADIEHLGFVNGPFAGPHDEFPMPGQSFDRQNYAVFFQDVTHFKEYVSIVAGFRYDKNSMFGSELTPRASLSAYIPPTKTKIKFSYSETFNAPLITLFVFDIQPKKETARSYNAGVEQDLWGKGQISSFFFRTNYHNLFDGVDIEGTTKAYAMGVETSLSLQPVKWITFKGSYTWTKARDEVRNVPLPDRPAHMWKAQLTVEPIERLILRTDLAVIGSRYVGTNTGMTFVDWQGNVSSGKLDGYVKLDLAGRYTFKLKTVLKELTLFTSIENILNRSYQEKFGFPEPGINFLSGLSGKFY